MRKIAIIPARGGSKRIPRKNVKLFLGQPLIAYSIKAAIDSGIFNTVMVSTDNQEIAEVALAHGAEVPFIRSSGNSNDTATTADVLVEVLNAYKAKNITFDYGCCIYATAPFIKPARIIEGFDKMIDKNFETVFPVAMFDYPVFRGLKLEDEKIKMMWPEYQQTRSQDLMKVYHDAGQWYWFNIEKFTNALFTENSGCIVLDASEVQDIDTPDDFRMAEFKMSYLQNEANSTQG